jgi:hypothetical protein
VKNLLSALVVCFILAGCAPSQSIRYFGGYSSTRTIDFRKYNEKGFLITPNAYPGEFTSIGMISTTIIPDARYDAAPKPNDLSVHFYKNNLFELKPLNAAPGASTDSGWVVKRISTDAAIEQVYNYCLGINADAISNFSMTEICKAHFVGGSNGTIEACGVQISGFAIKRK